MNQRYGVNHIEGTSSKDNHKWTVRRGESSLFLKEDELVGIANKRQLIMYWSMDGEPLFLNDLFFININLKTKRVNIHCTYFILVSCLCDA